MKGKYYYVLAISSLVLLLLYSVYVIDGKNERLGAVDRFFRENPEYAIEFNPSQHINTNYLLNDSLKSTRLSVILAEGGCPACIDKEVNLLSAYWDSISHSTRVYVVGSVPQVDSASFTMRRVRRDTLFSDPDYSVNPLFVIHNGREIKSIRLSDPTKYGYYSRDGEYYELVADVLSPQS